MVGLGDGGLVGLEDDLGAVVVDVEGSQDQDQPWFNNLFYNL